MSEHWSEPPAKPDMVQRLNFATAFSAASFMAFACVWNVDVGLLAGAVLFVLAVASACGAMGAICGHWRLGVACGLCLSALYLSFGFVTEGPTGGYISGHPGWPIVIPRE